MQRKALKQLGKVTQWTNEKVFNGEKTSLPPELQELEREIDPKRLAIERLHGTALPFYHQVTKVKPTGDPYPPSGSAKDKVLHTEALGLVMSDVGNEIRGTWGEGLTKYGRARANLAAAQEEFSGRIGDSYIAGMEGSIEVVNEYKTMRKKVDSRRLALDAAVSKAQSSKKDARALEFEVDVARDRFEEIQEECQSRMVVIEQQEETQWAELCDFMEAELEYFTRCKEIMEELRDSWPNGAVAAPSRPRANTNASNRSAGRAPRSYGRSSTRPSDDEEEPAANRSRSHSNASAGKGSKMSSMIPSFGSFGKKSGLSNFAGAASKRKSFGRDKERDRDRDRYDDDARRALHSDEDEDDFSPSTLNDHNRSRQSMSGVSLTADPLDRVPPSAPSFRRTNTAPLQSHAEGHWVKALYDFAGSASDELRFKAGDMVEVTDQMSDDWWVGECNGRHGMFPASYAEEYVATPVAARPVPPRSMPPPSLTRGRSVPPPAPVPVPEPREDLIGLNTSESELDSQGFSDTDQYATASMAMHAQPAARLHSEERPPKPAGRKPAPPPPPSRRSQSSINVLSIPSNPPSLSNSQTLAAVPAFHRRHVETSPEGSPFAGSEEEDEDEIFGGRKAGGRAASDLSSAGSTPALTQAPTFETRPQHTRGISSGLGAMHLAQPAGPSGAKVETGPCASCGCDDFTQNVFKAKGVCSTCFHSH